MFLKLFFRIVAAQRFLLLSVHVLCLNRCSTRKAHIDIDSVHKSRINMQGGESEREGRERVNRALES